jgi:thiamine biosynthesis protein ThiI
MTVIDRAAHMTILRPLVGFDKEEIIEQAKRLGTFEISIQPDQDSCTLFTPRHPETHARRAAVEEAEQSLPIDDMVKAAAAAAAVEELSYPGVK